MIDLKHALVDLAKDRNGVASIGTKHEGGPKRFLAKIGRLDPAAGL
jgi:hypothetical protein